MEIRLSRCTLRPWCEGDEPSLVRHADDPRIARNLRDRFPHPYTPDDAARWVRLAQLMRDTNFAIEIDGLAVGAIGVEMFDDVYRVGAEIGYWLGAPYWGRGVMTEAVRAVTEHVFATTELERLQAGVFDWNPASMRVLEKAGYAREGVMRRAVVKNGEVGDLVMYARLR